jgi:hypothetical protein
MEFLWDFHDVSMIFLEDFYVNRTCSSLKLVARPLSRPLGSVIPDSQVKCFTADIGQPVAWSQDKGRLMAVVVETCGIFVRWFFAKHDVFCYSARNSSFLRKPHL